MIRMSFMSLDFLFFSVSMHGCTFLIDTVPFGDNQYFA